ncbi:glycosyltransferase family 2 protein [Candidatus Woesebacteria bacterium]|nr:glycosyltransferase family 2 protein [Candidatus Woesebacteria bacterium]
MTAPLLSINIVSYNTKDITLQCLRSIEKSISTRWLTAHPRKDIEVIVFDNASTDGSTDAIDELKNSFCVPLRLIRNKENIGFGKGHNRAAAGSAGEFLFLLNTDTIVLADGLASFMESFLAVNTPGVADYKNLVQRTTEDYRIHFAGPKLLNTDMSPQPSCGPYYSLPVIFGTLFLRGDYWGLTRYSPSSAQKVDWVSGACILCKKTDFQEIGGFDEDIFMYMEEIELLLRARKKGMEVWFIPTAHIIHLGSASSNKTYPILQVYRGFLYLYSKHHHVLKLRMVQWMLAFKAHLAMLIGRLFNRPNVVSTYHQALQIITEV